MTNSNLFGWQLFHEILSKNVNNAKFVYIEKTRLSVSGVGWRKGREPLETNWK